MRRRPTSTVTSTTVAPSVSVSKPATSPTVTRSQQLGINAGPNASIAVLDACVELGVKWVRVSQEAGWAGASITLGTTVQRAHDRGLKVIQVIQRAGHKYDAPDTIDVLKVFATNCASSGVDVIEIGNEWNGKMFWAAPDVNVMPPSRQSHVALAVAEHLRTVSPQTIVLTPGTSPAAEPLNAWTWLPQFYDTDLVRHQNVKWNGTAIHAFCYPELATTNPAQWNPLKQVPTIKTSLAQRALSGSVWVTEIGAPGFATNAPVIRGIALTEQRQAQCFEAYFQVIRDQEKVGIKYPTVIIATMFDGQSATNSVEQGLGLITTTGRKKPAWTLVNKFAQEPML
ncbi:hypothetical protein UFOVP1305_44 [uncultured Caudovirales phage]|uniref:Glycoside hydrolase family 5 domain-containing protein n=1 Tax=uncultured Caudovirales phage TaxID=2100421 RepID=A0A6J5PF55_9CAUD|nr:hypothetical protein UFOVP896_82 [uncultured Caudovirales phage]CAB4197984.1 hypothetical protein UFOVP1305_44 [uncultured Caudovirales phage]